MVGDVMVDAAPVTVEEIIELGAQDAEFFYSTFFPKTFRQTSPEYAYKVDGILDSSARYIAMELFRDAAKTTRLRAYTMRRIAYGLARTVLFISKSDGHSLRSMQWLKKQIEHNTTLTRAFGLRPGTKWSNEEITIRHDLEDTSITILGFGITGSIRGVNIDDFRPDLIICDDVISEQNTTSPLVLQALEDLLMGAVKDSLAPASEAPHAKMIMLNTPITANDPIERREHDPEWVFFRQGILLEDNTSAWPERYPTVEVLKAKEMAMVAGKEHLWLREKECRIVSDATATLRMADLRYYEIPPDGLHIYFGVDVVPPPSMKAIAKGLRDKDEEVFVVIGINATGVYVLDYITNKGHDPDWTIATFFSLLARYGSALAMGYDAVNYQRTVGYMLEKEMRTRRRYLALYPIDDKQSKEYRILQTIGAAARSHSLYIRQDMIQLKEQYMRFPDARGHDDILDAVTNAILAATYTFNQTVIDGVVEVLPPTQAENKLLEQYGDAP